MRTLLDLFADLLHSSKKQPYSFQAIPHSFLKKPGCRRCTLPRPMETLSVRTVSNEIVSSQGGSLSARSWGWPCSKRLLSQSSMVPSLLFEKSHFVLSLA